jgi:hypothetical protein
LELKGIIKKVRNKPRSKRLAPKTNPKQDVWLAVDIASTIVAENSPNAIEVDDLNCVQTALDYIDDTQINEPTDQDQCISQSVH